MEASFGTNADVVTRVICSFLLLLMPQKGCTSWLYYFQCIFTYVLTVLSNFTDGIPLNGVAAVELVGLVSGSEKLCASNIVRVDVGREYHPVHVGQKHQMREKNVSMVIVQSGWLDRGLRYYIHYAMHGFKVSEASPGEITESIM